MRDLLEKVYKKVIFFEQEQIEVGKRVDENVNELIQPYIDQLSENEVEELKNLIYTACYNAQYEGFVLGAKTVLRTLVSMLLD